MQKLLRIKMKILKVFRVFQFRFNIPSWAFLRSYVRGGKGNITVNSKPFWNLFNFDMNYDI